MSATVTWLLWAFGALIGALVSIGALLRQLKDAGMSPEDRDEAGAPEDPGPVL